MSERDELIVRLDHWAAHGQGQHPFDMSPLERVEFIRQASTLLREAATALRADGARPAGAQPMNDERLAALAGFTSKRLYFHSRGPNSPAGNRYLYACDKCDRTAFQGHAPDCANLIDLTAAAPSPTGAPTPPQEPGECSALTDDERTDNIRNMKGELVCLRHNLQCGYPGCLRDATTRTP